MNRVTNSATARLKQDYMRLKKDPIPYIVAEPVPSNILEWCVYSTILYTYACTTIRLLAEDAEIISASDDA